MDDPKFVRKLEGSFLVQGDKDRSPPTDTTISCSSFVLLADVGTADPSCQPVSEASCRGRREVNSGSKDTATQRLEEGHWLLGAKNGDARGRAELACSLVFPIRAKARGDRLCRAVLLT